MAKRIKVIMESAPSRPVARKVAKRHGAQYKKFGPGNYLVYKLVKRRRQ